MSNTELDLKTKTESIPFICPITLLPFNNPWILLEDGFTYEKVAIVEWLTKYPNRSPMIGMIASTTILPNRAIENCNFLCPITKDRFIEPYYCVEDGFTYEKNAIMKWFETGVIEKLELEVFNNITVKNPVSGVKLTSLALYPNKILFEQNIPREQEVINMDVEKIFTEHYKIKNQEKCIFDIEIRSLIELFSKEKNNEKRKDLQQQINERRLSLGLTNRESPYGGLDLSCLNLSSMMLQNLQQKSSIFKTTNLSYSFLLNCNFSRCLFLNCNMQNTSFIDCDFTGEEVSFSMTNIENSMFSANCSIEKGDTWKKVNNWDDFKQELSKRGALNVGTLIRSI